MGGMDPRRWGLALFFLAGLAWAGSCAGSDVVLEVERPPVLLGGAEFALDGDVLTFSAGACLEAHGAQLIAAQIVYDRAAGTLRADSVTGNFAGWAVRAPHLVSQGAALVLADAVFERGDAVVHARSVRFAGTAAELEGVSARTSRYRFQAARGRLEDGVFVAEEVWSSPCKCGRALELVGGRASFRFEQEELVLQQGAFKLYGLALSRPQRLRLELGEPLDLRFPLRLSYDLGWKFGVEGLPLPAPGEAFGRWSTHLTLLAEGVGGALYAGKTEALRLAVEQVSAGRRVRFGLRPARTWDGAAWSERVEPDLLLKDGPLDFRIGWSTGLDRPVASLALASDLKLGPLKLRPFARLADETHTGLAFGAGGAATFARSAGSFSARLELPFAAAAYPDATPYAWGGARLRIAGPAGLDASAWLFRPYGAPRYAYEARGAREGFGLRLGKAYQLRAGYQRTASYDLATGLEQYYDLSYHAGLGGDAGGYTFQLGWEGREARTSGWLLQSAQQTWSFSAERADRLRVEWRRRWDGSWTPLQSELWASFTPAAPDCAGGWTLAPSLGWDLRRGQVSRAGLTLTLNDCCFAWTLDYQGIFVPQQSGEAAGHSLRFGVRLR